MLYRALGHRERAISHLQVGPSHEPETRRPGSSVASVSLEELLELIPLVALAVDESGEIVIVNHRVTDLLGWVPEVLIGRQLETLIPERFRDQHAEQFARFWEAPANRRMIREQRL